MKQWKRIEMEMRSGDCLRKEVTQDKTRQGKAYTRPVILHAFYAAREGAAMGGSRNLCKEGAQHENWDTHHGELWAKKVQL